MGRVKKSSSKSQHPGGPISSLLSLLHRTPQLPPGERTLSSSCRNSRPIFSVAGQGAEPRGRGGRPRPRLSRGSHRDRLKRSGESPLWRERAGCLRRVPRAPMSSPGAFSQERKAFRCFGIPEGSQAAPSPCDWAVSEKQQLSERGGAGADGARGEPGASGDMGGLGGASAPSLPWRFSHAWRPPALCALAYRKHFTDVSDGGTKHRAARRKRGSKQ